MIAIFMLVVITACGESNGEGRQVPSQRPAQETTVEEALSRLKRMVDESAATVAVGYNVEPDEGFEPVQCEDRAGNPVGTITAPYGVKFSIGEEAAVPALFDSARSFWREKGYRVSEVDLSVDDPAMEAVKDGYKLALHVVKKHRMAYLGGDTPCLPEADKGNAG